MAIEEQVIITIDLDNKNVKNAFEQIGESAKKTSKKINDSFGSRISNLFDGINNSILAVSATLSAAGAASIFFSEKMGSLASSTKNVGIAMISVLRDFKGLATIIPQIGRFLASTTTNIFGLTAAIAGAGVLLTSLGVTLRQSTNDAVRFAGFGVSAIGVALLGLSSLITFAILKVASLANAIGNRLVDVFKSATREFIELEKSMVIFNKTIENYDRLSHGAVGSTESWTIAVGKLSDQFNVSRNELRKSANEIVAVTSKLGLNEQQMKDLLKVSTEYAKINGKDLFQTTVNLVSALNGNGQAVQALGIKMSQAANTTFALKSGLDRTFASLSQNSKVSVRFNNLMKQYVGIVGIAAASTNTLSEQGKRLKVNQERLNESLGAGAAIIENNNILAFALNKVIGNVSDTVLKVAGFFGAFGARLLQVGGFILGFTFKIFALVKILKILNIILRNDATQSLFGKSIPFLGKSVNRLVEDLAGAKIQIKSISDLLSVAGKALPKAINSISTAIFGVSGASLTFGTAIKGAIGKLISGVRVVLPFILTLSAALLPIAITIGLIVVAFLALKKAFQEIEKRTGAFTELYAIMKNILLESGGIFEDITDFVKSMGRAITKVADVAFGLLITSVVGLIRLVTGLAQENPFNVFSQDTIKKITAVNKKLDGLTDSLRKSRFSIIALGEEGSRSIASIGAAISTVNIADLQRLKQALADVGKTDLEKITEEKDRRLQLITEGFNQELLSLISFENLKLKILEDFAIKRAALSGKAETNLEKKQRELQSLTEKTLLAGTANAFSAFGSALAKGDNALKAFADSALNTLGGFMVQFGTMVIAAGIASTALGESILEFNGAKAIAAGAALVVIGSAVQALSGGPASLGTAQNPASVVDADEDPISIDTDLPDKQTAVTINVQGTIIDPKSTGQTIAETLQEFFDTDGGQLVVNT